MDIVANSARAPRVLKLNAADNVVVAVDVIERGSKAEGVSASQRVPKGHKMAVVPIGQGEPVSKFGQVIGFAKAPIAPGEWVHEHNVEMGEFSRDYAFCVDA